MTDFEAMLPYIVQAAGLIISVVGAALMVRVYFTRVQTKDLVPLLFACLVKGPAATGVATFHSDSQRFSGAEQEALAAVQGLAWIMVGFLMQAGVLGWQIYHVG